MAGSGLSWEIIIIIQNCCTFQYIVFLWTDERVPVIRDPVLTRITLGRTGYVLCMCGQVIGLIVVVVSLLGVTILCDYWKHWTSTSPAGKLFKAKSLYRISTIHSWLWIFMPQYSFSEAAVVSTKLFCCYISKQSLFNQADSMLFLVNHKPTYTLLINASYRRGLLELLQEAATVPTCHAYTWNRKFETVSMQVISYINLAIISCLRHLLVIVYYMQCAFWINCSCKLSALSFETQQNGCQHSLPGILWVMPQKLNLFS